MTTTVQIPEDVEQRLSDLARRTNRSLESYVREAVERTLPELEWEAMIVQRAKDAREGRIKTIPLDEVVRELGLDG